MTLFTGTNNESTINAAIAAAIANLESATAPDPCLSAPGMVVASLASGTPEYDSTVVFTAADDVEVLGFAYTYKQSTAAARTLNFRLEHADDLALAAASLDDRDTITQAGALTAAVTTDATTSWTTGGVDVGATRRYFLRRGQQYRLVVTTPDSFTSVGFSVMTGHHPRRQ